MNKEKIPIITLFSLCSNCQERKNNEVIKPKRVLLVEKPIVANIDGYRIDLGEAKYLCQECINWKFEYDKNK